VTVEKRLERVESKYSASLMYDIMKDNAKFKKQFESLNDLKKHELFEDQFTTFEISLMCKQMTDYDTDFETICFMVK
jgi:hypothetical protein